MKELDHDDAFADAVARHHTSLARFAYMLCGNAALAEDAVAEAYARVWRRWRKGRIDNLFGYLRRTVANEVYGRHRRRLLERREEQRPPDRHPDGQFEAQVSDHDALWTALASLSPPLRVVVVLRGRRGRVRGRDRGHARPAAGHREVASVPGAGHPSGPGG